MIVLAAAAPVQHAAQSAAQIAGEDVVADASLMGPLAVGLGLTALCVIVHSVGLSVALHLITKRLAGVRRETFRFSLVTLLIVVMLAMVSHFAQIAVWAAAFVWGEQFSSFGLAYYHSAVTYTTLGYGDIVMKWPWKLVAAIEACCGIIAFGMTTAVVVALFIRLFGQQLQAQAPFAE